MIGDTTTVGKAKPEPGARLAELSGLDTSNVAGLMVIAALGTLALLKVSFGGITVSVG